MQMLVTASSTGAASALETAPSDASPSETRDDVLASARRRRAPCTASSGPWVAQALSTCKSSSVRSRLAPFPSLYPVHLTGAAGADPRLACKQACATQSSEIRAVPGGCCLALRRAPALLPSNPSVSCGWPARCNIRDRHQSCARASVRVGIWQRRALSTLPPRAAGPLRVQRTRACVPCGALALVPAPASGGHSLQAC